MPASLKSKFPPPPPPPAVPLPPAALTEAGAILLPPPAAMNRVVIVGGVAGGASCAARLRRLTEAAKITIFERQANVSYANCGLPYRIGDVITVRRGAVYACAARCCCPRRDAAPLPLACAPLVQGASAAAVLSPLICTGRCPRPLTSGASSCHPV